MSDLLEELMTPELETALIIIAVLLVILYVLSVIWVARDAYLRGTYWYVWVIVALIPLVGVIAYCLLRPPLYQIDRDEQELEIALKRRELTKYGECANCGYPVEADYVVCPNCHQRLKNLCPNCHHALDPNWSICPYCATPVAGPTRLRRSRGSSQQMSQQQMQQQMQQDPSGAASMQGQPRQNGGSQQRRSRQVEDPQQTRPVSGQ